MMKKTNLLLPVILLVTMTLNACTSKKTNNEQAVAKPQPLTSVINEATARRLVNNFNQRANHLNRGGLLLPDTRCVWFSVKQLKALVDSIQSEGGDGVRFYMAAYDKELKPDMKMINANYWDYATLVMVSTYASQNLHIDYFSNKPHNGKKGGILMAEPENQGELCPPPAKCNTIGATLLDNQ
ncbi:hypothetical protein HQ865_13255 [Mucilaginibacter mali]|uniref:Uncharacterized protein n=1 Tax=Mucilaginibacter mali TaxID=2740462 RepID=A0A7D4UPK5_9SPHI|nr:hypothetical protein [Mucilaginibacter mali]QKJ30680.1 hypothetical protein HQ865_13255 [Mucilaginibacter mali]